LAIGLAQQRLVTTWRSKPQQIKRLGGAVLVFVGVWLLLLAAWPDSFSWLFP